MRLLVQRVARASVEVSSCIESRIGPGLVLTLSVTIGDTIQVAQQLAGKVLALNLWPELLDTDVLWKTNVVDNGYEVLVMLQQSLSATFPKTVPNEDRALSALDAKPVVDAFVAKLKSDYQNEMIALAPCDSPSFRLEMTSEGSSTFVLGAGEGKAAVPGQGKVGVPQASTGQGKGAGKEPLKPELGSVTAALKSLPSLPRGQAMFESAKIFQVMAQLVFKEALAEATSSESDDFAEALMAATKFFTQKQQEKIQEQTGFPMADETDPGGAAEDAAAEEQPEEPMDDELEKQIAQLREEVADPLKGIAVTKRRRGMAKEEVKEEDVAIEEPETVRRRPDWTGRAAPDTPAIIAARQWALNRNKATFAGKGKGKSKGPRPYRSWGIASLDESSRLHGTSSELYSQNQLQALSDRRVHMENEPPHKRLASSPVDSLPKGTPTVAPMCPVPDFDDDL